MNDMANEHVAISSRQECDYLDILHSNDEEIPAIQLPAPSTTSIRRAISNDNDNNDSNNMNSTVTSNDRYAPFVVVTEQESCYVNNEYEQSSSLSNTIVTLPGMNHDANNNNNDHHSQHPWVVCGQDIEVPSSSSRITYGTGVMGDNDSFPVNVHATAEDIAESSPSLLLNRAEFVSATVVKPTIHTVVGLEVESCSGGSDGEVVQHKISRIVPNSLLSVSPLCVGDEIYSVNNKICTMMEHQCVVALLEEAIGSVTIVARNVGGKANWIETMITKFRQDDVYGMDIVVEDCDITTTNNNNNNNNNTDNTNTYTNHDNYRRKKMVVSNIAPTGLFSSSLLTVGDQILSINNISCRQLDEESALRLVRNLLPSEDNKHNGYYKHQTVTVLAQTGHETAAVIAADMMMIPSSSSSTISPSKGTKGTIQRQTSELSTTKKMVYVAIFLIFITLLIMFEIIVLRYIF